jgi:hypothetical protein
MRKLAREAVIFMLVAAVIGSVARAQTYGQSTEGKAHIEDRFSSSDKQVKPSATELFNLTTKCVALGDKFYKATGWHEDYTSHYNWRTNRCYVHISRGVDSALFDPQTRGMLMMAAKKDQVGADWTVPGPTGRGVSLTYAEARDKIYNLLHDIEVKP